MKKSENSSRNDIISEFDELSLKEKIDILATLVNSIKKSSKDCIPIGIFDNEKLSIFEAVTKYMKEDLSMRYVDIGRILGRDDKTIWATFNRTKKKFSKRFGKIDSEMTIPFDGFSNHNLTIFESVVYNLKQSGLTNHDIGLKLKRDDRTIWSVLDRSKKKMMGNGQKN
jgi:hypothetical protein